MSTTTPPMDHGTPSGSPLSDERGLERLFRAHYNALVEEAKAGLGDAAPAAPRVVEYAFRHAWDDRERFRTTADVEAYLHDEIRHGAAREVSRRAGHRYSGHTAAAPHKAPSAPNVEESWSRVSGAIHHRSDTVAAHAEATQALRHDAAEHMAALAKESSMARPLILGALGIGLAAAGFWWVQRAGEDRAVVRALAAPDARPSSAATGQMAIVNLDDGTRVTLVPESKVTVPKNFGANLRAVRIDGAARFTVRPGTGERFQVRARDVAVEATGTDFVVRTLAADSSVHAVVTEGSVVVRAGDSTRAVAKGAGVVVSGSGAIRAATPEEIEENTSWSSGRLTLANRQLRNVLPELKRWYGLDLKVPDLSLLDRVVTVRAPLDSPMEAIKAVEQSGNLKFGYEGETMVLRAAPAAKPASRTPSR